MSTPRPGLFIGVLLLVTLLFPLESPAASDLPDSMLEEILDVYAGNIYRRGETTGLAAAITLNGRTVFKSYGFTSASAPSPANAITKNSIFEIGSVTKIWTTVLVGQATSSPAESLLGLYTSLGSLSGPLPGIQPALAPATLGDLASFTAGLPDVGSTGGKGNRPPIAEWGVSDFVEAISELSPLNYNVKPPVSTTLPAPYFYSDWSTGLLGLLVTNPLDSPLPEDAVNNWEQAIRQSIASPLGMTDTYVFAPEGGQADRVVKGYNQATGEAFVSGGRLTSIKLNTQGGNYASAPAVTISDLSGSGASAVAVMEGSGADQRVSQIRVTNPGSGYHPGPGVVFGGPGSWAEGQPIVVGGYIVGVQITKGGRNYQSGKPPSVTFRSANQRGEGASGTAIVSNGAVVAVHMTSGGSGYPSRPVVHIAPGTNTVNVVPVWAAAGAIKSSASDLIKLCQLYLGRPEIDGNPVEPTLSLGARTALTPLILNSQSNPNGFTGMAWNVSTGDIEGGLNMQFGKDGGLTGFASYVSLVPSINLGVVILRSNNAAKAAYADPIGTVAQGICRQVQLELMVP